MSHKLVESFGVNKKNHDKTHSVGLGLVRVVKEHDGKGIYAPFQGGERTCNSRTDGCARATIACDLSCTKTRAG